MKRLLFVCGTPRSGTSPLAELLNTSPHVVLGVERFLRLLLLYVRDDPDVLRDRVRALFDRDRLLGDQLPDDSKPFPPAERESAMAKWDHATYVGDKWPQLYKYIGTLASACPEARFVYVFRNPYSVAASWQRRADNDKDTGWPAENGYRAAVVAWNQSLGLALDALDALDGRMVAVRYEKLFSRPPAMRQYLAVMDWLGFDEGPPTYRYTRLVVDDSVRRASASPPIPACIRRHVAATADFPSYQELIRRALPPRGAKAS